MHDQKLVLNKNKVYLSVVVPVYNETLRLHNLETIFKYLSQKKFTSELIIVNDGSTDGTENILKKLTKKFKFQVISYSLNQGKGFAVKTGMLNATGKYRLFLDTDLSTPIESFDNLVKYLDQYPVLIASRRVNGAKQLIRQPRFRELMGRGFTFLSQITLNIWITDFTCGFKCFSNHAAEQIFSRQLIKKWGFDSEILFIAKKMNLPVKEIPVVWKNDFNTKVKFPRDLINSLFDLVLIRFNDFKGKYN